MSTESAIRQGIVELGLFEAALASDGHAYDSWKPGAGQAKFDRYLSSVYEDLAEFSDITVELAKIAFTSAGVEPEHFNTMPDRFKQAIGYIAFQISCATVAGLEVAERRAAPLTIPDPPQES